jgi:hypothetical protein
MLEYFITAFYILIFWFIVIMGSTAFYILIFWFLELAERLVKWATEV